jgi:hypothetical protein
LLYHRPSCSLASSSMAKLTAAQIDGIQTMAWRHLQGP